MRRESAPELDPEVLRRHEFELDLLLERAIAAVILGKSPGGLALQFTVTNVADIGADHESKYVLGIDTFSLDGSRQQCGTAQQGGPERSRGNQHSNSESGKMKRKQDE